MNKIVLKHSRIEINDYNPGDSSYIEFLFSLYDPVRFQRFPKAVEYDPDRQLLMLPRGMSIETVKRNFRSEPFVDTKCDQFVDTDPVPIKYLPKDARQIELLKFLTGSDKYAYTLKKSQIAVYSTTGSGKTFVTVAAMCMQGSRFVIITSSINWLLQWKEKILEYTPLTEDQICLVNGTPAINKLLARDNPLQFQCFLISHATLQSYATHHEDGWYAVDTLFKFLMCSTKVFDEAHLYFDSMCHIDFHTNTRKTIYLTATPIRSNNDENTIYQEYFRTIPSLTLFDEDIDPHVNYLALMYYSHMTAYEIAQFSTGQYKFDRFTYIKFLIRKPTFRKLTTILIDYTFKINGKVLIYVGRNEDAAELAQYIVSEFPFLEPCIGIFNSDITDKEARQAMLMKKFIITTIKSCGTAIDISDLAVTIVLAEPFKSPVITRQSLGRCRADNTLYIDCVDMSCYRTKRYYNQKKPIFSKYAKSIKETILDDRTIDARYQQIKEYYASHQILTLPVFKS